MNDLDIQDYIERIVDNGDIESMKELSYMLEDAMIDIKRYDENCFKKYAIKLYKLAYGETLSKGMAESIVDNMRPYGMRWTLEEIKDLQAKYGFEDVRSIDVFVVMNSAYNDYRDIFNDNIEMYIKFAIDFIEDEDAGDGKVFKYYTIIPKGE